MFLRIVLLAFTLALSSCFLTPHRIDIQQGNYFDPEAVAKLKPGMTRSQVRFLLGTPLVADPFHPDRWDYLFIQRPEGKLELERRLTVWFDGDRLVRAVTDIPQSEAAPAAPAATAPAEGAQSALDQR
ncbi:MAG: outer membrane protein assembly factor BamE [Burkholderiales bacterium]|nr:outer membrane protein assembly factor BamE [Burkholderiales bacterium]